MKFTIKQKVWLGVSGLLLLLIITNPSAQAFKEYVGSSSYEGLHKETNYFICSKYTDQYNFNYIGILGNFYVYYNDEPVIKKDSVSNIKLDTSNIENQSSKYKLWEILNKSQFYTKTYDDFQKQFSTIDRINKLYTALNKSGYYTKSETSFKKQFFN
ncbi:MAG: hypothetical protein JWQ09_3016 [Segetibacter sp.]|nr:hypothetical protein [Segetibacter sp.]